LQIIPLFIKMNIESLKICKLIDKDFFLYWSLIYYPLIFEWTFFFERKIVFILPKYFSTIWRQCQGNRVAPNNRVLKHQFLKHLLQKDRLFPPKHRLSKTSNVKNINCRKHRLKYAKISKGLNGSQCLNIVNKTY